MKNSNREAGFSLIELLVSMAIMMVVVASLGSAFLSQDAAYRANEQAVDLQQDVKNVTENLIRDLNSAGAGLYGMVSYKKQSSGNKCDLMLGFPVNSSGGELCSATKYSRGVFTMKVPKDTGPTALLVNGVDPARMYTLIQDTGSQVIAGTTNMDTLPFYFKYANIVVVSNYNHAGLFKVVANPTTATENGISTITVQTNRITTFDTLEITDEGTTSKQYLSYAFGARKSWIGYLTSSLYYQNASDASQSLYLSTNFLSTNGGQVLRSYVPKISFELAVSTDQTHKISSYNANTDMCGTTTADGKLVTAAKFNFLARSMGSVMGGKGLSESSAYAGGVGFKMEAASSAINTLSNAQQPYLYRLVQYQVDMKNVYGVNQGEQNDFLADIGGCEP
jgi:prepilin-type N-terminal cleavage/methylation domain-containing protein